MTNFSIVIPIYNEEEVLKNQITKLISAIKNANIKNQYEILLVENGSTDATMQIAKFLAKKYKQINTITLPSPSYGMAFKKGIEKAKYNFVFQFDIDFWDILFLKKSLKLLQEFDIVIGSKNLSESSDGRPLLRKIASRIIELIIKFFFHIPLSDTHGIKALKRDKVISLIRKVNSINHFFDTELLIRAFYSGLSIKEIPVNLSELRKTRFAFLPRMRDVIFELYALIRQTKYFQKEKKLFFHADDFGYKKEIDLKILQLANSGKIHEMSILANMADSVSLKNLSKISVPCFLHLNFIEGNPISSWQKIQTLINNKRSFFPLPLFVVKLLLKRISITDIRNEISSQIRILQRNKIKIKGIDSHQHVHALSPIAEIVAEVLAKDNKLQMRSYGNIKTFTISARLKFLMLKVVAFLSYFIWYRKIGMPVSWKSKNSQKISFMSWEGDDFHASENSQENITYIIHPYLGYDTNTSYEDFFNRNK